MNYSEPTDRKVVNRSEQWIFWLKIIACLLITNSHCRAIYPAYFLAIGGGFGNAIFFAISGYLAVDIKLNFPRWYLKKLKRLVGSFGIIVFIDVFFLSQKYDSVLFYLNKYWFVSAIVIYYIFFYLVFYKKNKVIAVSAFAIWLIGYFALYVTTLDLSSFSVELENFSPFKVYFYFGVMIVGGLLRLFRSNIIDALSGIKHSRLILLLVCGISISLWIFIYGMVLVFNRFYRAQFLIQFSVLLFCISLIIYFWKIQAKPPVLGMYIANSTLEIYLVQIAFGFYAEKYVFPINWLVFWLIAFLGGCILNQFIHFRKMMEKDELK